MSCGKVNDGVRSGKVPDKEMSGDVREPTGAELSFKWWNRLFGVREKLFAPFVVMIVLELFAGAGIYLLTRTGIGYVNTIYQIGKVQQYTSQITNVSGEENLNLMLGRRGALSRREWETAVEELRAQSRSAEKRLKEQGREPSGFASALAKFRESADLHISLARMDSAPESLVDHDRTQLDPSTRQLFSAWHGTLDVLDGELERQLVRLNGLGRRLPFLPFMGDIVEGGNLLGETIRRVRTYERVKELAVWAEIKYVDYLDTGSEEDLRSAKDYFRLLRMRLNGISRDLTSPEEEQIFVDISAWTEVFDELLSEQGSSTTYPYLPVALYRNGMPLFTAISLQGQEAMNRSYQKADLIGSSVAGLLQIYSWILVFFAGLALFIAMLLGRIIMQQIGGLHDGFLRLGMGDFRVRLNVDRSDEIGALQEGFNRSATDLESRDKNLSEARDQLEDVAFRLQHYNENLEREVQNRTTELRKANEELRRADRMKSEFMANMSHELRTPLNSIIGFSKVLLNGIDGALNERQEQDLELIHQSGRHLLNLINEVLDFAKIESGRLTLYTERLDPDTVAAQILETARTLTAGKGLSLFLETEDPLPGIIADRTRLTQMLLNLVSNAVKFTDQGSITLHVAPEERLGRPGVAFSVIDTGTGISADEQRRVFEKFHQIDSSSTRRHGGSGLGLSIAKELAELHGGTISLTSSVGQGSTFTIWLPVNGPEGSDDQPG